jgi:hypothetical protein
MKINVSKQEALRINCCVVENKGKTTSEQQLTANQPRRVQETATHYTVPDVFNIKITKLNAVVFHLKTFLRVEERKVHRTIRTDPPNIT